MGILLAQDLPLTAGASTYFRCKAALKQKLAKGTKGSAFGICLTEQSLKM
ncbi:MAG: hypothetical protein E6593_04875 [Clostridium sp.]|nr:hypothetical protein [Clostridium sp.]